MSTTQHLSITDCHDAEAHTSHPNIPQCRALCCAYSSPSACVGLISPRNSTQRLLHSLTLVTKLGLGNSNPILPGWNPDPTILRVGDDYFISTSTFEYFPGHPIYHSKNLVDWTLVGHALNRPSQLHLYGTPSDAGRLPDLLRPDFGGIHSDWNNYSISEGLWAPGLRHHAGVSYLTSTARYVYSCKCSVPQKTRSHRLSPS